MASKRGGKVRYEDTVLKENEKDSTHGNCVAAEKNQQKRCRDREPHMHSSTEDGVQRPGAGRAVAGASNANGVNTHAQHQTREAAVSDP
jgi:hypothetical protein